MGRKPLRQIRVCGVAEVQVVPDSAVVKLEVETVSETIDAALAENDSIVKRVFALTQELTIPLDQVQTDRIRIDPRWDRRSGAQIRIGFTVRKSIVLTLTDLSSLETILTQSLKLGVNHVQEVLLRTTELREHRDHARALALTAAKEKAAAMASELNARVGPPLEVVEEPQERTGLWRGLRFQGNMRQNVSYAPEGSPEPFEGEGALAPGRISVTAMVQVTFELETGS